jgi:leucyl/phenylalanyl-tRNA--protein transferase
MVILDENEISFPDPHLYHPKDGLIAIGGDLSVERIWFAYQLGIFPWLNGNCLCIRGADISYI